MSIVTENKYICTLADGQHGLGFYDGEHHTVKNCFIDLSNYDLDEIDEAAGITWGCSALFDHCVIRGAGKLVLCGCGDEDKIPIERGKTVEFHRCILEDFGRRGPEVQDGMKVYLTNCLIRNWGNRDRFDVRSFAGWAHGEGSFLRAYRSVFWQDKFFNGHFWADLIGHIGQAVNDGGLFKIFTKEAWLPGMCRGLTATCGGDVMARQCYANHWWISLENSEGSMSRDEAIKLVLELDKMRDDLYAKFGIKGDK